MDTSLSMLCKDASPTRLGASKAIAIKLIDALPEDRIGIMAYAGSANVITSLTVDHPTIKEVVTQLDTDSAHIKGSDLSAAVRAGIKTLEKTGKQANALIIFSDGSAPLSDMDELLESANEANIQIFCIGIGSEAGSSFFYNGKLHRDQSGKAVISKLEKQVLQQLAIGTSGEYIDGTIRASSSISRAIKRMDQYELEGREQLIPKELYQWFLAPGLALLVIASLLKSVGYSILRIPVLRSKSATLTLLIVTLCSVSTTHAQDSWYDSATQQIFDKPDEIRKGYKALEAKNYPLAIEHLGNARELSNGEQHATLSLALAQSYYRSGDFTNARICYSDAMISADKSTQLNARYNMSNALYKQAIQPLSQPKEMNFLDYLKAAIRGDQGISGISESQLDSMEKGLLTTLSQYQEVLELEADHAPSIKNKSSAEALLKIIQNTREIVRLEIEEEERKKQEEKDKQKDKDQKKDKPKTKPEEEKEDENKSEPSQPPEKEDEGNKGKEKDDPKNSGKESKNGTGKNGENGGLKPTNKDGGKKQSSQDMPDLKDKPKPKPAKEIKPDPTKKFKTKEEALKFLKDNQDTKKKPLDHYNSRFWKKPPTVDW